LGSYRTKITPNEYLAAQKGNGQNSDEWLEIACRSNRLKAPLGAAPEQEFNKLQEAEMSRGMPSMTALLGMLAIAGFQNRDKLIEMFNSVAGSSSKLDSGDQPKAQGGLPGSLTSMLGGAGVGGMLGSGLNELLEQFTKNGQGEAAESWIGSGPNKEVSPPQLRQAIGQDVLTALEQQTGLSQEELLARLSRELPTAIDKYTPEGRLPPREAT
jgi:uncharacterized protein YidB (DUF937 family)